MSVEVEYIFRYPLMQGTGAYMPPSFQKVGLLHVCVLPCLLPPALVCRPLADAIAHLLGSLAMRSRAL